MTRVEMNRASQPENKRRTPQPKRNDEGITARKEQKRAQKQGKERSGHQSKERKGEDGNTASKERRRAPQPGKNGRGDYKAGKT
jgi:hypothetical protein